MQRTLTPPEAELLRRLLAQYDVIVIAKHVMVGPERLRELLAGGTGYSDSLHALRKNLEVFEREMLPRKKKP